MPCRTVYHKLPLLWQSTVAIRSDPVGTAAGVGERDVAGGLAGDGSGGLLVEAGYSFNPEV